MLAGLFPGLFGRVRRSVLFLINLDLSIVGSGTMAVRKTDTEYGGRGGVLPPAEFQLTEDLSAAELAMLDRQSSPTDTAETRDVTRARLEKRANKNDRVGR